MKRFKIKNLINGLEFQVEREELGPLQPEWGKPAWTEIKIAPAILDDEGNEISPEVSEEIQHAAEYQIIEEDISAEIEAKELKKQNARNAHDTLKGLAGKSLTPVEQKVALENLLKLIFESDSDLATTLIRIAAQNKQ